MLRRSALTQPTTTRDSGFTLIELLVSLVLLAAIMIVIPSTIRLAARASVTSAELVSGADNSAALAFVQQTLAEAMPLLESDADGKLAVAFAGSARSLSFVAPLANGPSGGGLYRMQLEIADGGAAKALLLRLSAYDVGAGGAGAVPAGDVRRLAAGLSDAGLRYFGLPPGKETPEWSSAWTLTDRLPEMVELTLVSLDANAVPAAPMRIELRLRRRL